MTRTVLMVAFHFPPAAMGSGHLRTLGFARYLPAHGWQPLILSARPLAYPRVAPMDASQIPQGCRVTRAFALDASRQLAIAGHYPGWLAQPDRWASWRVAGVAAGMRLIRRQQVDAIWSTYPIMSAHCIAHALSRRTGLPWIADFRDPVFSSVESGNAYSVASQQRWEARVMAGAARAVFTTPGAQAAYGERYPSRRAAGALQVIQNGYDESLFADMPAPTVPSNRPLLLVHSGLLYPDGRDPTPFFAALAKLKVAGAVSAGQLHIRLRASGQEAAYQAALERLQIRDLVELAPPVSNRAALVEQAAADGLLLFQGPRFDRQIPAKVYEYLRIGRPIFALVGDAGDTAGLLQASGGAEMVAIDDADAISSRLPVFLAQVRARQFAAPSPRIVADCSRAAGAGLLAGILDEVAAGARANDV